MSETSPKNRACTLSARSRPRPWATLLSPPRPAPGLGRGRRGTEAGKVRRRPPGIRRVWVGVRARDGRGARPRVKRRQLSLKRRSPNPYLNFRRNVTAPEPARPSLPSPPYTLPPDQNPAESSALVPPAYAWGRLASFRVVSDVLTTHQI